jgi:RHS repeat-associated protein
MRAGGIGGLLAVRDHGGGTYHFVGFDGNGNVTVLVNASDQTASAQYEYSPFGELIRATGPLATTNPFRWSTKFWDEDSELAYYGYRSYSPRNARWLNRDPMQEDGGINLYAFASNNAINGYDALGHFLLLDILITNSGEAVGRLAEIKRGQSFISQVRSVVKGLNNMQQFEAGVMDAQGLDISTLLENIEAAKGALSDGLRGVKTGGRALDALDGQHIFPKAKAFAEFFKQNRVNARALVTKMNWYLHQYAVHTPGTGGAYNRIWAEFIEKNKQMRDNPYYVIGFGFGLFEKIATPLGL